MKAAAGGRISSLVAAVGLVSSMSASRAGHAQTGEKQACVAASEAAQDLRARGKLRQARQQLLVCSRDACPAVVRKDCGQWLAAVQESLPSMVVGANDSEGRELEIASVEVDGSVLDVAVGTANNVDPGVHSIHVKAVDGRSAEQKVTIREGEKNRAVIVTFPKPQAAATTTVAETSFRTAVPAGDTDGLPRHVGVGTYVFAGVGLLSLGSFAYFGLTGRGDAASLRSECAPHCAQSDVNKTRTKLLVADVSLGVGLVSLGLATYFYLSSASQPPASTVSRLDVNPLKGGGATVAWSFQF
ncbi:MAG: hypothetical protein NVS3B20_15080 [Polyangiales bacterium]